MENLIKQTEFKVNVAQHQIWLLDEDADWDGSFDNDDNCYSTGVGIAEGVIGLVDFRRGAGTIPLIIELYQNEPSKDDINEYSRVIETSINISSGKLFVENENKREGEISLPANAYQVRIYYANEDTCGYGSNDGANHARILLFPKKHEDFKIIKEKEKLLDNPVKEYNGNWTENKLIEMLSSPIISYRCLAIVGLLRLGKLDIVKTVITNAPDSVKMIFESMKIIKI